MTTYQACTSICLFAAFAAGGCNYTRIPTPADLPIVYKIDIQQGNVVTQEMLAKLQPGMDKSKVRFIMGTPLIVDVFHQNRWDYLYTLQERGGEVNQRRVSLFFKDDKLDRIEGDVKPASGEIAVKEHRSDTVEVPEQEKTLLGKMKDKMGSKGKNAEPAATAEAKTPETGGAGATVQTAAGESAKTTTDSSSATAANPAVTATNTATESNTGSTTAGSAAAPTAKTQTASTDKSAEVTIPEDAPRPPEKSFFRKLLEKVGVGDNEGGSYEPSDPKYKDPSNPDTTATPAH